MEQMKGNVLQAALEFAQVGKEIPTLQAIILFGSAATGEMHKKSDIDLLLVFDTERSPETGDEGKNIYRRAGEIERQFKLENPFSFVFLNRGEGIDADFLWQVTKNGTILYLKPESVIGRREFLTPSLLFSYSFQGIPSKDQMYVDRRLYGYRSKAVHKGKEYINEKPGLIQLHGGKLGRATFIIDARMSDDVQNLFDEKGVKYAAIKVWSTDQDARIVDIEATPDQITERYTLGGTNVTLVHGQPISGEYLEQQVSAKFDDVRFTSLCNAIVWASSNYGRASVPSFTERVSAPDGGIDLEWTIDDADFPEISSPLLISGWNVFQSKKRNVFAQGRKATITEIKSKLKGALQAVHERLGRYPDNYVLFTNVDLTHKTGGDKEKLIQAIKAGYEGDVRINIVGAAELASFLNDLPHLRSAYFATAQFETWEEGWKHHIRGGALGHVAFVGRQAECDHLDAMLNDPESRVIVISGPPDIGKTRLALEATKPYSSRTVIAVDSESLGIDDLSSLQPRDRDKEVILIIDEEESGKAGKFIKQAITLDGLKLIITVPTLEPALASIPLSFQNQKAHAIKLDTLSNSEVDAMLTRIGVRDYSFLTWIDKWAEGNPGLILEAVALGPKIKEEPGSMADKIGKQYEIKTRNEFGDDAVEVLKLLSLLRYVGIEGELLEIKLICELFGDGITLNSVLNKIDELKETRMLAIRGSYAAVRPRFLASHLTVSALRGRVAEVRKLYDALDQGGKSRLLSRFQTLTGDEAVRFWDELLDDPAVFGDLRTALANDLFQRAAPVRPKQIAALTEKGLNKMDRESRLGIRGYSRMKLVWTLQILMTERQTSLAALRCLAMLAEAETETHYSNNATGVFIDYFAPYNPQVPLPLRERSLFLERIFREEHSIDLRLVAIKAIESGIDDPHGFVVLNSSEGLGPLSPRPAMTYGEIWDYKEGLVDLLMEVVRSEDARMSEAARAILPRCIYLCARNARPPLAVLKFETVVKWTLIDKMGIAIDELVTYLQSTSKLLNESVEKATDEQREEILLCIKKVDFLLTQIEDADFSIRLRRWISSWTHEGNEYETQSDGTRTYRGDKEIKSLANDAVANPSILSNDDLVWLCSDKAQRALTFFWWLGNLDLAHKWTATVENLGGVKRVAAFGAYFTGLSKSDGDFVVKRLHEFAERDDVSGDAILAVTGQMDGNPTLVRIIEQLIRKNKLDPAFLKRGITPSFIESLHSATFLRLLKAIAGPNLENGDTIIELVHWRWHLRKRQIGNQLATFVWKILQAPSDMGRDDYPRDDYSNYDSVAAYLTRIDKERGFMLLAHLLTSAEYSRSWNPLREDRHKFWTVLLETDHDRALRTVMEIALNASENRFQITWELRSVINITRDKDFLIKFALEGAEQALVVCACIDAGQIEFWSIASEIIGRYEKDAKTLLKIQQELTDGAYFTGKAYWGGKSSYLEQRLLDLRNILKDSSLASSSRLWLEGIERSFYNTIRHLKRTEADEEIEAMFRN